MGWDERRRERVFGPEVAPLVGKIIRLRNDLGVNYTGIGVVLDLLTRFRNSIPHIRHPLYKTMACVEQEMQGS